MSSSPQDISGMAANIIYFMLFFLGLLVLGFFVYGLYLCLKSRSDSYKFKKAKSFVRFSVVGIFLLFASFFFVNFLLFQSLEPQIYRSATRFLEINSVTNTEESGFDGQIEIQGEAPPFSLVNLYIHPESKEAVVDAGRSGDWSYILDEKLKEERYEVYAVIVNQEGEVMSRATPFVFHVDESGAVKKDDKVGRISHVNFGQSPGDILRQYVFLSGLFIALALPVVVALFFYLIKNKDRGKKDIN